MSVEVQICVRTVQGSLIVGKWEPLDGDIAHVHEGMGSVLTDIDNAVTLVQEQDDAVVFIPVRQVQGITVATRDREEATT